MSSQVTSGSPEPPMQRELFTVTGSTALDNLAKQDISEHLRSKDIRIVSDTLMGNGVGQELAAALETSATAPCWVSLLEAEDGAVEKLFSRDRDGESAYLITKYGHCFGGTVDETIIAKLFPAAAANPDTYLTASSEPADTPDNEKRVFTFDNEPVLIENNEEDILDGDDVAGELPMIPKTPEPRSRLSFSSAGRAPATLCESLHARPASASSAVVPTFKARPAPNGTPSITPRLTKAAALRLGLDVPEKVRPGPRQPDVSTLPPAKSVQTPTTPLKSLAQPSITPRHNKASAARLDKEKDASGPVLKPTAARRQSYSTSERNKAYEGMAGFGGRRLSVQPAMVSKPKIMPKQTKASSLRSSTLEGVLPPLPSTTARRQSYSTAERAALFGSVSGKEAGRRISIASLQAPSSMPKGNKASLLRNGGGAKVIDTSGGSHSRESTTGSSARSHSSLSTPVVAPAPLRSPSAVSNHSQPARPSSGQASHDAPLKVAQRKPAIVPRVNKAAELRMAARNAQAA